MMLVDLEELSAAGAPIGGDAAGVEFGLPPESGLGPLDARQFGADATDHGVAERRLLRAGREPIPLDQPTCSHDRPSRPERGLWRLPRSTFDARTLARPLRGLEDGRFGRFVNEMPGGGRTVRSDRAIFVVNIPGVWGVNLVSIWFAHFAGIGIGLIGIDLTLVNAVAHLGATIALRCYDPGLVTAILLFLPRGIWALAKVQAAGAARLRH